MGCRPTNLSSAVAKVRLLRPICIRRIRSAVLAGSTVFLLQHAAYSQDPGPKLPSYRAAQLAQQAIKAGGLPADCWVRDVTLVESPNAAPYYRIDYKASARPAVDAGGTTTHLAVDVIHVSMAGNVSFVQEKVRRRVRVINR